MNKERGITLINILIDHKNKKEFEKDIEAIKKIFDIVEMSDIKEYKKKYYIEIDAIRKRENKI